MKNTLFRLGTWLAAITAILLALGAEQSYAAGKHPYGREDYLALRWAGPVAVSPDGRDILYEVTFKGTKGPAKHEWWLTGFTGEKRRKLELPEQFTPMGFTKDGALYGGMQVEKHKQLAVVPLAPGRPTTVIMLPNGMDSAAISPDGTRFALLASPRARDPLEGTHTVVENGQTSLYVVGVNGADGAWWCPELKDVAAIAWAADSARIAVVSENQKVGHHDLRSSVDVCGRSDVRHVTGFPNSISGIAWSNGGQELVFAGNNTPVLTPDHVWSVAASGGQAVDRTPQLEGSAVNLAGDAHGTVWVEMHRGVITELDKFSGGKLETAYRWPGGSVSELPVSTGFASSPNVLAFSVTDPEYAQNVAVAAGGDLKRITHEGEDLLANCALGEVRVVHWTSREGIKLEGIVTFPAGYTADKKWPFLVMPHGGPELNDQLGFSQFTRMIAGMGYVVLQPQYRGSTGYGTDFLAAIYQHFGDRAYRDVDSATDFAIAQGWADPDRLAMFGWSAGGFMTAWTVTQTHRYRAAIEGAGITDWLSFIPSSDIWQTDYDARLQEKDPTPMLQFSAVMHADQVTTPLLILHGEADLRVPVLQGREFFVLLAERGKTVRMVTYPGSQHFPRLAEQQADIFKEIEDWLKKYNP